LAFPVNPKKPKARNRAAFLFASLWFAGCGDTRSAAPSSGSALEQTHVTIGLAVPAATYLPLYVAVDEGMFAKQGLQADLEEFRGGSELIKAVVSRSVDVGVVSLAEITSGIDAGQPLKAFYAGFNIPDFDWYGASSIKSLADVKGKRIGITQYGSSTDFITRYALAVNGLDPSRDVQIIQAGPPATRLAAMQAGQLDVSIFSTPEKFLAQERGYKLVYSQKQLSDDYPQHLIFATEPFLTSHPNTIKALLRGHTLAVRLAKQDKHLAEQSLIKHLQFDPKYAEQTYADVIDRIYEDGRLPSQKSLDVFFDMGIKAGRYTERWALPRFWTPIYVDSYSQWMPAQS
jgi:NitT/TauT family transport system substrate-binding protein